MRAKQKDVSIPIKLIVYLRKLGLNLKYYCVKEIFVIPRISSLMIQHYGFKTLMRLNKMVRKEIMRLKSTLNNLLFDQLWKIIRYHFKLFNDSKKIIRKPTMNRKRKRQEGGRYIVSNYFKSGKLSLKFIWHYSFKNLESIRGECLPKCFGWE